MSRRQKQPAAPQVPDAADPEDPSGDAPAACPVVGVGASAGGLQAFERLFTHMPPNTGMAFVLVQHLDPTHQSLLTELVQRYTRMKVAQVIDGQPIAPDHVYVIPPNRDLALHQGRLHLLEPVPRRGLRLPIDQFFRSLAQDQGERAIAVVLSGTGTDGTLGVRAVKGEGGMVMVQAPESAAYDGMPVSALDTGLADFVLAPEEMPAQLVRYARDLFARGGRAEGAPPADTAERLAKTLLVLRGQTGHDFSQYKPATLARRVERRMVVNRIEGLDEYVALLQRNPGEIQSLFKDLLIGVTGFFRDRDAFAALVEQVLPDLFADRAPNDTLRIWVPACATGEEAYSIALALRTYMEDQGRDQAIQIFATDIDPDALETARAGRYPESIAADVPADLLRRYFERHGNTWQVGKQIREMIVFAAQSLIKDPPFSRLDLVSCRNLLIYLQPPLQRRVLGLFNYVLRPGGWLFLGSAESLGELSDRFTEVDRKWRIYRSCGPDPSVPGLRTLATPGSPLRPRQKQDDDRPKDIRETVRGHTQRLLLEHYAPVAVTVDERCDILYVQGRTNRLLETPSGDPTLNLLRLARDGLRAPLSQAIQRAVRLQRDVGRADLQVASDEGPRRVHLTVRPVTEPAALRGMLTVVLQDAGPWEVEPQTPRKRVPNARSKALEKELADTREYLQSVVEQLETTNEELTSTNEEMQSSNEEMQSTNEELETSQEELRSVNEELVTVNAELRSKVNELAKANNDLANLMASTELAILFVDDRLRVQRFTPAATGVLHLVDSDIGRPLGHISTELDYGELEQDVEHLLDTLTPVEKEVRTRSGRWQLVRIRPYRTTDNAIEGAVLTVLDIHEQKRGEELKKLTRAIEQSPVSVVITDHRALIEYVNPRFTEITGYSLDEAKGQTPRILKSGEHPPEFYRQLWETLLAGRVWRGEFRNRRKNGELYWDASSISPVRDPDGRITHYVSVQEDITARRQMESLLRESEGRYRDLVENIDSGVAVYRAADDGNDFRFLDFNQAGERIEGLKREALIGRSVLEVFPGIREMGLFEVLRRVWRTGRPEHHPVSFYQDGRIEGWRDNHVYRLPTGEVVTVYEDVTERARAEESLRREQAALQGILAAASLGIGMVRERRFEWVSDRLLALVGYRRDDLIGQSSRIFYADDAEFERVGREKYAQIHERGVGEVDTCFRHKDGRLIDVRLSSCALDPADLAQGVVFTALDTTALRRSERELAHAARILRALSQWHRGAPAAPDEAGLCRELCRILVREGGYRLAWVGFAADDPAQRVRPVAHEGFDDGYLDSIRISWGDNELGRGPTGTAIRTGRPGVMRDILHDPAFAPWKDPALERGYASSLALPVQVNGHTVGALSIYCTEPDAFDEAEVALLGEVAGALGWAIGMFRERRPD